MSVCRKWSDPPRGGQYTPAWSAQFNQRVERTGGKPAHCFSSASSAAAPLGRRLVKGSDMSVSIPCAIIGVRHEMGQPRR